MKRRSFLRQSAASVLVSSYWSARGEPNRAQREWRHYVGDPGTMRYSPLDQINASNIGKLQVAWVYHTLDSKKRPRTTIECTPLVVDGVMYLTTALLKVCALDAATGAPLWRFDPFESVFGTAGANATVEGCRVPLYAGYRLSALRRP